MRCGLVPLAWIQVAASVLMPADPDLSALLRVRPKVMLGAPTGLLCRTQLAGCAVPRHARDVAGPASSREIAVQRERSAFLV